MSPKDSREQASSLSHLRAVALKTFQQNADEAESKACRQVESKQVVFRKLGDIRRNPRQIQLERGFHAPSSTTDYLASTSIYLLTNYLPHKSKPTQLRYTPTNTRLDGNKGILDGN